MSPSSLSVLAEEQLTPARATGSGRSARTRLTAADPASRAPAAGPDSERPAAGPAAGHVAPRSGRPARGRRNRWLPPQHGAWAMLLLPFVRRSA
ncbi:hypothetical protein ACGFIY_10890 [Micromonospora chersina]|uniref:hypothetical protein n=1 Tax=Micromonospora chersina TaxID=47854 RepID=UPI00372295B0